MVTIGIKQFLYRGNTNSVRNNEESPDYITEIRVKQGCILSPLLFSTMVDKTEKETKKRVLKVNLECWRMRETDIRIDVC